MTDGLIIPYGDVAARCGAVSEAYAEFAGAAGLHATVLREELHPEGTRLFVAFGHGAVVVPAAMAMSPRERAKVTLPMLVAALQVLAVMAEGVLSTDAPEGAGAEILRHRGHLREAREAMRSILGERYPALLGVGLGPEICAEFDAGRPGAGDAAC